MKFDTPIIMVVRSFIKYLDLLTVIVQK